MKDNESSTRPEGQVLLAILISAILTHYSLTVITVILGATPNFADINALMMNAGAVALMLAVGWLTRRIWIASLVLLIIGLVFITPYLFVLKSSPLGWIRQFVLYVGLPLMGAGIFSVISNACKIPMRPPRQKTRTMNLS